MRLIRSLGPLTVALVALLAALPSQAGYGEPDSVEAQLKFGADMAKRGLWSEAYFRFRQAERLEPRSARVLNNLAVAAEALGLFEEALGYYRDGLQQAPNSRELRGNYDRFLGFYEAYKARKTKGLTEDEEAVQDGGTAAGGEDAGGTASSPSPSPEPPDGGEGRSDT